MTLAPIPPIGFGAGISPLDVTSSGPSAIGASSGPAGSPFAAFVDKAIAGENRANDLAVQLATGKLTNPAEFTTAAASAQLTVEMTAAVRNRAVEAFNDIMRMQV